MNKREFCKTGLIGVFGIVASPKMLKANPFNQEAKKITKFFESYTEIDGFLSPYSLKNHYTEYYLNSFSKLNKRLIDKNITLTLRNILESSQLFDVTTLNLTGEVMNHRIFWKSVLPAEENNFTPEFQKAIESNFGNLHNMVEVFHNTSKEISDNGWIWLIYTHDRLKVVSTFENENPFLSSLPKEKQGYPIFGIDLHQHAFSEDYIDRYSYIEAFFNQLNRNFISKRFNIACKQN